MLKPSRPKLGRRWAARVRNGLIDQAATWMTPQRVASLWLRSAQRRTPPPNVDYWENRRHLVRKLAPGKTFVDIGGMWEVHGRVAFWAEEAGARRVVLLDAMDPSEQFAAEHARRRSQVTFFQADLHDLDALRTAGTFDVVWCTGVVYHTPNPYLQLRNLREVTGETLVLGSHVIPELPGIEQGSIFYPGMSAPTRTAFAAAHERASEWLGMAAPFDYTPMMGYANNWWGLTPSALVAMLELARFDVGEQFQFGPFAMDVVAAVASRPDVVPPEDFVQRRFQALLDRYAPDERPPWLVDPSTSAHQSSKVTPE